MSMTREKRRSTIDTSSPRKKAKSEHHGADSHVKKSNDGKESFLNGISSKEAHHKQKALKAERLAAKPNADSIARSKKIWERLRIKSAVPKDERQKLVKELLDIINGRVKEFVFKHDSVRVIQCALKYATPEQKTKIAEELKGSYKELAESKYAKFLVAKLIVLDPKVRDLAVPEFYGHVKRLMRNPEAGWIVDDIYRSVATPQQKTRLLREWYGGEYAVLEMQGRDEQTTADLNTILKESPGKRGPIMQHLKEMTNQLVQKKTTGFTMLHDALLQYFLNCSPGTPEHTEFLEMLRDDEEGDLFKNLAFTKSGSRVVCLALAYGTSKDRRTILKHYKTHIKLMATDTWAHLVLLAAYEVIDDTVMTAKAIFPELASRELDADAQGQELLRLATHINGRIPLLYLMAEEPPKWLLDTPHHEMITEVREVRQATSKKDPSTRRIELNKALSPLLLDFVNSHIESLLESSYGCQLISEVLIGAVGDKTTVLTSIASLAADESMIETLSTAYANRLYKALVQGGRFDTTTKTVIPADPPLGFGNLLYGVLQGEGNSLLKWATSPNSWSILAMLESKEFLRKEELIEYLQSHRAALDGPKGDKAAHGGTRILLERIDENTNVNDGGANGEEDNSVALATKTRSKDSNSGKRGKEKAKRSSGPKKAL